MVAGRIGADRYVSGRGGLPGVSGHRDERRGADSGWPLRTGSSYRVARRPACSNVGHATFVRRSCKVASSYFFVPFRPPARFRSPDPHAPPSPTASRPSVDPRSVTPDINHSLNCPLAFRFANAWFRPVPIRSEAEDWLREQRF